VSNTTNLKRFEMKFDLTDGRVQISVTDEKQCSYGFIFKFPHVVTDSKADMNWLARMVVDELYGNIMKARRDAESAKAVADK
jgi:hypothetical protein